MRRIHVFPSWRDNPYLNMLYIGARAEGWTIDGSTTLARLLDILPSLGPSSILHVHWTSPILQDQASLAEARAALDAFRNSIAQATARGARVLWTVHNLLPHGVRYLEEEVTLRKFICDIADVVFQLNPSTASVVDDLFPIPPEKLVTLRHASYIGLYAQPPSRDAAKNALGIPHSSPTVGFVGQIRPYKGVDTLLGAMERVSKTLPDVTLLLAGRASENGVRAIDRRAPRNARIIRSHEFVPDTEIGTWFTAADILVFPYTRILNSGSVLLSATFGRACILPGEQHLRSEHAANRWVSFFDIGETPEESEDNLSTAILAALKGQLHEDDARRFAAEYVTTDMAMDFVHILEDLEG